MPTAPTNPKWQKGKQTEKRTRKEKSSTDAAESDDERRVNEIMKKADDKDTVNTLLKFLCKRKYMVNVEVVICTSNDTNGVEVLSARQVGKDDEYCTADFMEWLRIIFDPSDGLQPYRRAFENPNNLMQPITFNEELFDVDPVTGAIRMETLFNQIFVEGRSTLEPENEKMREMRRVYGNLNRLKPLKRPIKLEWTRLPMRPGDIFVYQGIYRTYALPTRTLSLRCEYVPTMTTPQTEEQLNKLYEIRQTGSVTIPHIVPNASPVDVEYNPEFKMPGDWNVKRATGKKPWDIPVSVGNFFRKPTQTPWKQKNRIPFQENWQDKFPEARAELLKRGCAVIEARDVIRHAYSSAKEQKACETDYDHLVDVVYNNFVEFFNWATVQHNKGLHETFEEVPYFDFDDSSDEIWKALTNKEVCKKFFGDEHWMQRVRPPTKESNSWPRSGWGQLNKNYGYGNATLYGHNEAVVNLACHPAVLAVVQQMYDRCEVFNAYTIFRLMPPYDKETADGPTRSPPIYEPANPSSCYAPFGTL